MFAFVTRKIVRKDLALWLLVVELGLSQKMPRFAVVVSESDLLLCQKRTIVPLPAPEGSAFVVDTTSLSVHFYSTSVGMHLLQRYLLYRYLQI